MHAFQRGCCNQSPLRSAAAAGFVGGEKQKRPQPLAARKSGMAHGRQKSGRTDNFALGRRIRQQSNQTLLDLSGHRGQLCFEIGSNHSKTLQICPTDPPPNRVLPYRIAGERGQVKSPLPCIFKRSCISTLAFKPASLYMSALNLASGSMVIR